MVPNPADPFPTGGPVPARPIPSSVAEMPESPLVRHGGGRSVLVIGAGMAGMAAAYRLREAGHQVRVLEASGRAGGRVHTLREPFRATGLHAEVGALFLPSFHELTMGFARKLDLPLVQMPPDPPGGVVWYLRGTAVVGGQSPSSGWPVRFSPGEAAAMDRGDAGFFGLWGKYVFKIVADLQSHGPFSRVPEGLKEVDAVSFAELLRREGASPGAVEALGLGYLSVWGDGIESISALQLVRDLAFSVVPPHFKPPVAAGSDGGGGDSGSGAGDAGDSGGATAWTVAGGNDRYPTAFAEKLLGGLVTYHRPVVRIEQGDDGVAVVCRGPAGQHRYEADRLVVAIPFAVLRDVEIEPAFSSAKAHAVRTLPNTSVTRLFVETTHRSWNPEAPYEGRTELPVDTASTDLPLCWMHDATVAQPGPNGIIEAWACGEESRKLRALSPEERLAFARARVGEVFRGIGPHLHGGAEFCWDEQPWARGAYCFFRPGQMTELLPALQTPEGRIHFAGDHTSSAPGWIEGALESGLRAAREVHGEFRRDEAEGVPTHPLREG